MDHALRWLGPGRDPEVETGTGGSEISSLFEQRCRRSDRQERFCLRAIRYRKAPVTGNIPTRPIYLPADAIPSSEPEANAHIRRPSVVTDRSATFLLTWQQWL